MMNIHPQKETQRIVSFLKKTFQRQGIKNAVIGLSGGVDSMTSYYLLKKALPAKNIYPVHLPYEKPSLFIPQSIPVISIKKPVDEFKKLLGVHEKVRLGPPATQASLLALRAGNVIARIRMIILFDLAKKHKALVCGTENKTEHLLGYFTRFGDSASDIEPIQHLYKTQVRKLAQYLGVPKKIIDQHPTAGLWSGQTDEGEFGFTYEEADQVLYFYFENKLSEEQIQKKSFKNVKKIILFARQNRFKHLAPYTLPK